ncbi:hypothetical protein [Nocardia sp. NPDC057227]|uniref:hypothetical protein n=1 Tax=Nocardia sp. NPDC057227 TaxID=3346056 RepID=UPI00362520AB
MEMRSMQQSFAALSGEAGSGNLGLRPGVADDCARQCDEYAAQLRNFYQMARNVMHVDSFGALPSATLLGEKFERLAIGGPGSGSYADAITEHIKVVETMADMFRKAGAAYTATEQSSTADIGRST